MSSPTFKPAAAMACGVNRTPSRPMAIGKHTKQLSMVITLNKLMLSIAPLIDDKPIIFLLNTLRD